ncbi:TPM domain-containing protein [Anaeromyxobacter oryzae]|uniref:TPM domain-containing protein n=1 Tax=Anaeromyxobacter oryzae TaxID=2918170 RepID=A0ABN6MU86_9BACT|nr:TPM domain-containing protein [Anaeromyxobacter oryzae]BDG04554.1 hypothetical protein AMOR_35500 [Anaeromyxobacter oryzae]
MTPVRALAIALAVAASAPAVAATPIPPLTGPVVDQAGLLDGGAVRRLTDLSVRARGGAGGQGVQLQYLIVKSLEGEPIEDYSIRVAEAWKIGSRGKDNGVLVTVAVQDRAVRIEVGGGLEGGLTDAQSSRIIRGTIVPAFQAGRFGDGLYDAGVQILGALGALPSGVGPVRRAPQGLHLSTLAILAIFVLVFVVRAISGFGPRRRRSLWWGGGPWIGGGGWGGGRGGWGGGGFGGGGGGGWSGGGGGFSGGGASGRW